MILYLERDYKVDFVAVVLFIGFVFFLPNTFYVITDFIHIDSGDFYTNIIISYGHDSQVYMNNIQPYILLMHIVVSMFISVLAGIKGLLIFEEILVNKKIKKMSKKQLRLVKKLRMNPKLGVVEIVGAYDK